MSSASDSSASEADSHPLSVSSGPGIEWAGITILLRQKIAVNVGHVSRNCHAESMMDKIRIVGIKFVDRRPMKVASLVGD